MVAHVFSGVMWIVPWIAITSSGISVPWHLAYLVAVIVGFAALALTRDRRTVLRHSRDRGPRHRGRRGGATGPARRP